MDRFERMRRPPGQGPPVLEVQIHLSDIRSGVKTLFFSRARVRGLVVLGSAWVSLLLVAVALSPGVLGGLFDYRTHGSLAGERARLGTEIQKSVGELRSLRERGEALRLLVGKVLVVYGLEGNRSAGQGGFPLVAEGVPETIYADAVRQGNRLRTEVTEDLRVLDTFLAEVLAFESAHRNQIATTPSICPLSGDGFVLTSPFGTRRSPFTKQLDFHAGIDLAAPSGLPIAAAADGVVMFAGRYPLAQSVSWWRYGNLVAVRHDDQFVTLYGHCDEVRVRSGQRVRQGDLLATVGNTGWSTSPHLHYEVRRKTADRGWVPVDPRIYILNHRWRDEEQLLVRGRSAPDSNQFEPLPATIGRS
jgi:murein DD-endopeptidase MepM/ murein hydrolase activator NlpD